VSRITVADCESYGLRSVERDPDTDGGYVGCVASREIAVSVVADGERDGLRASWTADEPDGSAHAPRWWVYLAPDAARDEVQP
jgi:hypothetical protein